MNSTLHVEVPAEDPEDAAARVQVPARDPVRPLQRGHLRVPRAQREGPQGQVPGRSGPMLCGRPQRGTEEIRTTSHSRIRIFRWLRLALG